jgi:hypothetical protein
MNVEGNSAAPPIIWCEVGPWTADLDVRSWAGKSKGAFTGEMLEKRELR